MTDQKLQELKDKLESLIREQAAVSGNLGQILSVIRNLEDQIKQEERERETYKNMENMKEDIRKFFIRHRQPVRTTEQLWMVKINGETFRSHKGKYTWTTKGRAIAAVASYLCYYDYDLSMKSSEMDITVAVKELVKDGYIELIKVY